MEEQVKVLKKFRDNVLSTNSPGRCLVRFYYSVSPPIADFIAKHDNLQGLVRWSLLPLRGFSWMALRIGLVPALMLVFMLLALVITSITVGFKKVQLSGARALMSRVTSN